MTKMRVHELAKELGLESKELLDILTKKEIPVKSHASSLESEIVEKLREERKKSAQTERTPKSDKAPESTSEAGEVKQETDVEEAPVKKKNIVQVFRPQNTQSGGLKTPGSNNQRAGSRSGQIRPGGSPDGRSRPIGQGQHRPAGATPRVPRPIGGVPGQVRPDGAVRPSRPPVTSGQVRPIAGDAPRQPRPEGTVPRQPRPEGAAPRQPRPEGAAPRQSRPEGTVPRQPRPEGAVPRQPRPEGAVLRQPRPEGVVPKQLRPAGAGPKQPRPEGTSPRQPRPEGTPPQSPRPEGAVPRQQRSADAALRPPRNEGAAPRQLRPAGNTPRQPRPEGAVSGQSRQNAGAPGQTRYQGNRDGRPNQGVDRRPRSADNRDGKPVSTGEQRRRYEGGRPVGEGGRPRPGDRSDVRRDSREPVTALTEQQKAQRAKGKDKGKDKEKDFKKNESRNNDFTGKGKQQRPGQKATVRQGQRPGQRPGQKATTKPPARPEPKKPEPIKQIILPEVLTIKELADKMKIVPSVIVKKLFLQGKIVTVNQEIDYDTAEEIAMEFEVLCEKEEVIDVIEELLKEDEEDQSKMEKRPPVVCVMGHVDHGKTSLLDAIRKTNQTDREAGGITQHIGAYMVTIHDEKITFLDTPGHEAFTAMRMRGANSTDVAILVVAADDGVMPQTVEAISHAKAAGVEIIVAINKIDKPSANIDRVKQELSEYELISEDWGGSTIFVPVSARTGEGIQELLEMVILTSEVLELKANPDREARGLVIEAELDKGKGSVATVLVQKGTLRVGDAIAAGSAYGKVRAMIDDKGKRLKVAVPSQPVEILGLNSVPNAGDVFVSCKTEKEARAFGETFISQNRVKMLDETKSKMSLDDLFTQIKEGNLKELNIIVKGDVQGSVEALKESLLKLSNEEVVIKIIHGGVGAINESDVSLASTSNAIIIGFNVRPDVTAKEIADREKVDLRLYRVIYNAIEDVQAAMKGMLDPVFEEKGLGHAQVRQIFTASGVGTIAGSYILDGVFERGCMVRLTREGKLLFEGPLASLKRFKDDVREVRAGYECGLVFTNFNDIQEEDQVEAYKMVEMER